MLIQHRYVYLYHDDYGYASLSYAVTLSSLVQGQDFTIAQLMEFLVKHYEGWGGRVLSFALEILVLRWGVWPYRILQAVVLTTIMTAIYQLLPQAKQRGNIQALTAILLCCCYGLIDLEAQRSGTYWASAAFAYVWPFAALFTAAVIHARMEDWEDKKGWLRLPLFFLYFVSGWSQEQLGLVGIFLVLGLTFTHLTRNRKSALLVTDAIALASVLAGYAILMLAPGNQARVGFQSYEAFNALSLFEKIQANFPTISNIVLGRDNQVFLLIWVWVSAAAMWNSYRSGKRPRNLHLGLFILCCLYGILLLLAATPVPPARMQFIYQPEWNKIYMLFWVVFLAVNILSMALFCFEKKAEMLLSILIGGLVSQAVMLLSPALVARSNLIFLFSFFPVLVFVMVEVVGQSNSHKIIVRLALLAVFCVASSNTFFIIRGYAANGPNMDANNRVLRLASQSISEGKSIHQIELKKLVDDRFGAIMPYAPDYDYINYWIREYYNLSHDVELIWK